MSEPPGNGNGEGEKPGPEKPSHEVTEPTWRRPTDPDSDPALDVPRGLEDEIRFLRGAYKELSWNTSPLGSVAQQIVLAALDLLGYSVEGQITQQELEFNGQSLIEFLRLSIPDTDPQSVVDQLSAQALRLAEADGPEGSQRLHIRKD